MKATGIVRRIDDLGRIMIPKEVRRTTGIAEGDPLEIFLQYDMVCFAKYNAGDNYAEQIERICKNIKDDFSDIKNNTEIMQKLYDVIELLKDGGENNEQP